ncbi:hypothetical protein HanRHA438_Chr04g0191161 [Helianthus annuus]|nr:hypothetical protein HanIR_Chr04g0195161 [Helianthus annuus]KAJ0928181.1 hypothetical protein HanRHA438_Chr04g0191161 [Helianthus annuus]
MTEKQKRDGWVNVAVVMDDEYRSFRFVRSSLLILFNLVRSILSKRVGHQGRRGMW